MKFHTVSAVLLTLAVLIASCGSRDNPEALSGDRNTEGGDTQTLTYNEHPGHPIEKINARYSTKEVREAIKNHIEQTQLQHHGLYPIRDDNSGRLRTARFETIKLIRTYEQDGDTVYFGATTFQLLDSSDHEKAGIDYWMKPNEEGNLVVYEKAIHELDGEPRYYFRDNQPVRAPK